jgi:acyl-coenzyme A thioesterase 7
MDFVSWIRLGDLCTIRSKVVFCSSKTLEIEIVASVASIQSLGKEDTPVAKGRFIFASLGKEGKPIPVPPLKLETDENYENAFLGQQRYEAAKRARVEAASSKR